MTAIDPFYDMDRKMVDMEDMREPNPACTLCVAIGETTLDGALAAARQAQEQAADVIEIRLDCLDEPTVSPFVEAIERPLLFTNRPEWEGGRWRGEEPARIELLLEGLAGGAAYVDIELLAPQSSRRRLRTAMEDSPARLIMSNHNFSATPSRPELLDVLRAMKDEGADIGKIVTTAHTSQEALRVLRLQEDAELLGLPLIAFAMGRAGVMSRLATLGLGGYMTYCALADNMGTAPGQIGLQTMQDILKLLRLM